MAQKGITFLLLASFLVVCLDGCNRKSPFSQAEFMQPDIQWRPIPLWFWNDDSVQAHQLAEELHGMIEKDFYGGCAILPFGGGFRPDYLSEEYFNLYAQIIEQSKAYGARMSMYDEYGFPSGNMGTINGNGVARFRDNHPQDVVKRLDKQEYPTQPSSHCSLQLSTKGKRMSTVAFSKQSGQVIPLGEYVSKEGYLEWDVPAEGEWTIMDFTCVTDGDPNVDYLCAQSVQLFIQDTHEQYYSRFPSAFGSVITSTFFDEPTMYRAGGRMWTDGFNERFTELFGCSPETYYPALWYEMGDQTAVARNMLYTTRATLYSEGFMKTVAEWATEHGILSTGHQDQEEVRNPVSVSGDLMLCGKYMTMPGIDKIGGPRPAEDFYKVVSSSANNWDHPFVMSETYGAMGNIPFQTLYSVAVEQYTKGINNLIPHAVWYNDNKVTFLPELSYRNPLYCDSLPDFNRFLSRLNYILARPGRHIASVAVLYPIQTLQAGHYLDGERGYYDGGVEVPGTDYNVVSRHLTDELGIDFTYLHPEVLDTKCHLEDNRLVLDNQLNREEFTTILLPGVKVISTSNMQRIYQAWQQGMHVIFTTQKPCLCADLQGSNQAIRQMVDKMLSDSTHPAQYVAEPTPNALYEALQGVERDVEFPQDCALNYIHKVIDGKHVYLFGNIDNEEKETIVTINGEIGDCQWMDPHTGQTTPAVPCNQTDGSRRQYTMHLAPARGMFLISK